MASNNKIRTSYYKHHIMNSTLRGQEIEQIVSFSTFNRLKLHLIFHSIIGRFACLDDRRRLSTVQPTY